MGDKVVITGGAGFVGSLVARKLLGVGREVTLVDDMSFGQRTRHDPLGPFAPLKFSMSAAPRCSAPSSTAPTPCSTSPASPCCPSASRYPCRAFDGQTSGTGQVLEAARRAGVRRVVFSSTSAVYENSSTSPHTPDEVVVPDLVYAMTKQSGGAPARLRRRLRPRRHHLPLLQRVRAPPGHPPGLPAVHQLRGQGARERAPAQPVQPELGPPRLRPRRRRRRPPGEDDGEPRGPRRRRVQRRDRHRALGPRAVRAVPDDQRLGHRADLPRPDRVLGPLPHPLRGPPARPRPRLQGGLQGEPRRHLGVGRRVRLEAVGAHRSGDPSVYDTVLAHAVET